jgi:PmbA protein
MPGLIGADGFEAVAQAALELPGADGVEVLFMHDWGGLSRFASSQIHQSIFREDTDLRVRVETRGRVGVAATNDFSPKGAREAAVNAKEMAEMVAPDPLWPGLAPLANASGPDRFDEATASSDPESRADAVAALIGTCADGYRAAGAYETQAMEIGVATTAGQRCWAPFTQASLTTVINGGEGGSGFAEAFAGSAGEIDAEAVGGGAPREDKDPQRAPASDAGSYVVILEPAATATLVGFLAWMGFGGRALLEGRSCFSGKEGQTVAAPGVGIWDDGGDPGTLGAPFDFEGVPRQRVDLIRDGVFEGGVYDLRTAKEAGVDSTGHGLPSPNPEGPFPLNLFMGTGTSSVQEMIEATERGILVTRFHYSNVVNPIESSLTGMTRDGTFLISGGEIAGPVRNLRFTQSIVDALAATSMIGDTAELASEFFFSASRVPALRVDAFNFSGVSDH